MAGVVNAKQIIFYQDESENEPFKQWLNGLRDGKTRQRILARLRRVEQGNYGDHKSVGEGVLELRFFFGAGYRVYFAEDSDIIVILLTGGDKDSQDDDIEQAKMFWQDYQDDKKLSDA